MTGATDTRGFFRRHWMAVVAFLGFGTLTTIVVSAAALHWYDPSIFSVLLSWPALLFLCGSAMIVVVSVGLYLVVTQTPTVRSFVTRADTTNQLSTADARLLSEWTLYHEHDLLIGSEDTSGVVPVTDPEEGVTTRIFEWQFREKNAADDYVFLMDLEQPVTFHPDYVHHRTPRNEQKAMDAMRNLQNTRLLTNPSDEEVEEARDALGKSVRHREVVEEIGEDGQPTKRIKRDRHVRTRDASSREPQQN